MLQLLLNLSRVIINIHLKAIPNGRANRRMSVFYEQHPFLLTAWLLNKALRKSEGYFILPVKN